MPLFRIYCCCYQCTYCFCVDNSVEMTVSWKLEYAPFRRMAITELLCEWMVVEVTSYFSNVRFSCFMAAANMATFLLMLKSA